jgi:ATP-binding cassette subfamily B (MDR/TAP) protein 1
MTLAAKDIDGNSSQLRKMNVRLRARPGHTVTREEVIEACKAVGIHDFMSGLPDGYKT